MQLSEEQRRVVTHGADAGHLLILAAPGSGKTRTVVERIRHLLESGDARPEQIQAVTFTRKAAEELRERLGRADVQAGTFHQVCADLLAKHGEAIGWGPPLRIFAEDRTRLLLEEAAALGAARDRADERDRDRFFRELIQRISRRKRRGAAFDSAQGRDRLPDALVADIHDAYCSLLTDAHALDYDDLILRGIEVLGAPEVAETVHGIEASRSLEFPESVDRGLKFLFLDEFQDVSPEQFRLIRLLVPPGAPDKQVLAVADPDQAIFGWRDADAAQAFRDYQKTYRPSRHALRRNFRSTGSIVAASQGVLADRAKTLPGDVVAEPGHRVLCHRFGTEAAEAEGLVGLIERARAAGHYRYGDIAVLYRNHDRANVAEAALLRRGIPIWRVQRDRFFARPDVQEAIRYLELVVALHDDCFGPALNWPRVLVDEPTMIHLRRTASAAGLTLCELARRVDDFADQLSPLTRSAVRGFLATVDAGLAPLIDEPIDRVVERLLGLLAARRSPIPGSERETLFGILEFLAVPLEPSVDALRAAMTAGRQVAIRHADDPDALAAALILAHVLDGYVGHPTLLLGSAPTPAGAFTVSIGEDRTVDRNGFGLIVRRTRSHAYSLSTLAWRLGQLLLMRDETLDDGRFVLFDLETGNRHPSLAEILEVGAQPIRGGELEGKGFVSLVRPSDPSAISAGAADLNGLSWRALHDAPAAAEVLPRFLDFLGGAVLVGHNIEAFDYFVLCQAIRAAGLPAPGHDLLDTWKLARRVLPDAPSHRLIDLAHALDPRAVQEHRALPDARLNAVVFRHLLAVGRRERELDVISEVLPLVAVGIRAAGVPVADENATLVLAGARAAAMGQGGELLTRWRDRVGGPRAEDAIGWLEGRGCSVPSDDAEWDAMAVRWGDAVDVYRLATPDHGLRAFLRYAALAHSVDYQPVSDDAPIAATAGGADDETDPRRIPAADRVAMMSIHSAKGKEWPLVFLLGCDGHAFRPGASDEEDEERRVLYVGMTRAQRRLCLLWAANTERGPRALTSLLRALPTGLLDHRPASDRR